MELSLLKCQKLRNTYHYTLLRLGFPINHIVPIYKPKQAIFFFYKVCLRLIVDVCIYTYFLFNFFLQNYIIYTTHNTILSLQYRHIFELFTELVMQHISQTILKEIKEVMNQ